MIITPANNGATLKWRVEQLEKIADKIDGKVDDLLTNHIPHLAEGQAKLQTRINVLSVVNVSAIVIALAVTRFL